VACSKQRKIATDSNKKILLNKSKKNLFSNIYLEFILKSIK